MPAAASRIAATPEPLQRFQAMAEGEPVDENRRNRVDEGQRAGQCRWQFLDRTV